MRRQAMGGTAVLALALGACANLPRPFAEPPTDVRSPLAGDLKQLDLKQAAYPSFLQVPGQPTDVRPTMAWNSKILDTLRLRRQVQAMAVVYPQTLYGAEAFAQENRALAAPPLSPDAANSQASGSAAFAKENRARATPPSPAR